MKQLLIFVMTALLLFNMTACDSGKIGMTGIPADSQLQNNEEFVFRYNGTEIRMHAPAAPIIEVLGEPKSYTEQTSCAFDGLDKTYYYGSFYLDTYPADGEDFVYGWWFADDSVSTEEGIRIGDSQTEVEAAYGTESFNGSNTYTITKGGGTLTVILEDGTVASIQYAINME